MTTEMTVKQARLEMPNGFKFRKQKGLDEYKMTGPENISYFSDELEDIVGTAKAEAVRMGLPLTVLTKFQERQQRVEQMLERIGRVTPRFAAALRVSYPIVEPYELAVAENFVSNVNMGLLCELADIEG